MVADKLFQTLDKETGTYISTKQDEDWYKPADLAKERGIYFVTKVKNLNETRNKFGQERFSDNRNKNRINFLKN